MLPALWHISLQQWWNHRLRLFLTTMSVALGVAVFFAIRTANITLLDSLRLTVEKIAGKATLQITAGESGFPEEILDKVRSTTGVTFAEPVIEVVARTAFAEEGNLLILGIDTAGDQQLRDYQFDESATQIADPLVFLAQPDSILLSRSFADRHGLKVGDRFPLYASMGRRSFTVRGIFKPIGIGQVFGGNIAIMDVYSAQVVFDRGHNFDRIDLINSATVPVETVQQNLHDKLPAGIEIVAPKSRGQGLESAVTAMRVGLTITSFTALLVGIYIIFNSFTTAVSQRWKEIGILRAIGVERRNINLMFLCEALLMGMIGSIVGIAAGYYLAEIGVRVMANMTASVYGFASTVTPAVFRVQCAATSFVLGVVTSLVGAWFPARAASQLDPAMALHNIESRNREAVLGWRRVTVGFVLVSSSVALMIWTPSSVGGSVQFSYAVLMLLGLTALLPKVIEKMSLVLRPFMDWTGGAEGGLAVDAMIRSPRRSSATVGALMVGLMFVFSTAAYIQSYRHMVDRWMKQSLNADIFVATSTTMRSTSYHFNEKLGQQIAGIAGVKRVENVRFTTVPYNGDSAALIAIEMDGFMARAIDAVQGKGDKILLDQLPKGEGVLVSRNFATRWGARVEDILILTTPNGTLKRPILGILDDYRSEKGTIFIDRALYKQYWHDNAVDFFFVSLNSEIDPILAKREIQNMASKTVHAFVYTQVEFKKWVYGLVDQFFVLNYMQLVIAVIVSILGIVNTLMISVSERKREIGIIRAIGGLRTQIRKLILLEAVAISIVGVALGALAGMFSTEFMSHTISLVLVGYAVPFDVPWVLILISLPLVIMVSLLAGWWPARHAVTSRIIEAIGYE
jgi:putative ABC transport system permease protein